MVDMRRAHSLRDIKIWNELVAKQCAGGPTSEIVFKAVSPISYQHSCPAIDTTLSCATHAFSGDVQVLEVSQVR
jgi:hypothetical protein